MLVPMSPVDALFLLADAPQRPMHVGALALLTPPDGADWQDVRRMMTAPMAREQVATLFRRVPHRSLGSLGQWCWRTAGEVDLGYHVRLNAVPRPGGVTDLWELSSRLHAAPLDRSRPLWQLHLIEGLADGRYAMYIKIHHALADGVSAMRILQRMFNTDPHQRGMPALWEPANDEPSGAPTAPTKGTGLLFLPRAGLEVTGELAGLASALTDTAWRAVCRRGGPLTLTAPASPFSVPIGGARSLTGQAWPIERLRLIAKCADATVNEVVLAMCSGALRGYLQTRGALPTKPLVAMVPVSLRCGGQPDDHAGNMIGALTCSLATHLEDPAERLAAVRAGMREGKSALAERTRVQTLAMSALGGAPLALAMALGRTAGPLLRPANVMISNLPGPATPLYWNGARLDTFYPLSVPVDGQALNVTCTSIGGQIAFGLTGCRRAVPDLHALPELLDRELNELEKVVGSPSMLNPAGRGDHADRASVYPATGSASEGLDAVR